MHVCGMSSLGQQCTSVLVAAGSVDTEARDAWGYTALQRMATNNCAEGAEILISAGASHTTPSGVDTTGESARDLARRLRSYDALRVFQQYEIARGIPRPDGEMLL